MLAPGLTTLHIETGLNDYCLVIKPTQPIRQLVKEGQQYLIEHDIKFESPPCQINIAMFKAREEMEETIIRWIQRICNQQPGLLITLNNYSGHPPGTVYLKVQERPLFFTQQLQVVNSYISACSCPSMTLISTPRLEIARIDSKEIYFKALAYYSHKLFHHSFEVDELQLVRLESNGSFRPVNVFRMPALISD